MIRRVALLLCVWLPLALTIFVLLCTCSRAAELAIGDSIAVGLNLPGDAKVGRSPAGVAAAISMMPIARLHGHVVILSTGLSNDPLQMNAVVLQLEMLKAAGAKVIVLGVGDAIPGSVAINQWLKAQAETRGMGFVWGWSAVHPASYPAVLRGVREVECQFLKVCEV